MPHTPPPERERHPSPALGAPRRASEPPSAPPTLDSLPSGPPPLGSAGAPPELGPRPKRWWLAAPVAIAADFVVYEYLLEPWSKARVAAGKPSLQGPYWETSAQDGERFRYE